MKGAATWIGFTLAAASAVWGGEPPASPGKGPPRVGGEVEIANVPFDLNEVIRTVRKNRGLPEDPPHQGFRAEARGERPFVSKGNSFSHETPRFQAEVGEGGLRYFAQGGKGQPDLEILSVSFEQGDFSQTVFGKNFLEEHAPGLLQGETRDGVTPYVRNRGEEGIEIYWTVDEPLGPEASALRVRLAIRAAGKPREHDEGLVFPAWRKEGQVAFSNVTVVDAAGRLERIRPSHATSQEILFEMPREFLENSQYPILIDPTVGPEFPVEPSPVLGPPLDYQRTPSVASNGTDYFVVCWWQDKGIYGARVTSAGVVLDPRGIAILPTVTFSQPSVASNGIDYFVAGTATGNGVDIYGVRVSSAGAVLDPSGIAISTAANGQYEPSVASNGTDYFLAWSDYRSGTDYDIYGARVASDGTVLDPAGVAVSTAADWQLYPSVASNGTDYFVAWQDQRSGADWDIYGARVTAGGSVLEPSGIAISTQADNQLDPAVASDGVDYLVVWEDIRNSATTGWDIYGARVQASDGLLLDGPPDTGGIAIATLSGGTNPSVASNGTDYFVVWPGVKGTRVTSAGIVLDPSGIDISTAPGSQVVPSIASNGTDYFVAWEDTRSGSLGSLDIFGTRVTESGTVLDPSGILIFVDVNVQFYPSVASNGVDYFVAWEDYRDITNYDVYGARVTSAGTVLDLSGIAISTEANWQRYPSVASNGTDYFVAWEDRRTDRDVYGARVSAAGTLLDVSGIAVSKSPSEWETNPSAASDGADYFVVWVDTRNFLSDGLDVYGARVRASDGVVLDSSGIRVSGWLADDESPSVTSNGTDYFTVWHDCRKSFLGDCTFDIDIYGSRVRASDGARLDLFGIPISTAASFQTAPSVVSDGTDYLVVWQDDRNWATTSVDIYGTRVTSAGALLDGPPDTGGITISTATSYQLAPVIASNGTDYFVAWEDNRSGTDLDIYGARVTSGGSVLDPSGLLIQQSAYFDEELAVAYSSCGKYLVTYHRFNDAPEFGTNRIMARMFYDGLKACVAEVSAPSGIVPLLVEDAGGGQVEIWWENHGELLQYNIYEGDLDAPFYNHLSLVCWTAGTDEGEGYLSGIITPSYTNAYYLVTECDTATEGTSGYDSDAAERNPLLNTCGPHP
ncbi:MAG: hypothetical protein JSV08_08795 [Acidobacteriota bacterium]|nr:MAG: hypothetical protein JSV08_08795 [Acidobacteriota bacterium]